MEIFLLILIITISLHVMRQSYLLIQKNKLLLQKQIDASNSSLYKQEEVHDIYKGVDKNKIILTNKPNFNIDIRTNDLSDNTKMYKSIKEKLDKEERIYTEPNKNIKLMSVKNYDKINVDEINKSDKVFIYPQKGKYYRYVTI
tara:strand:+ start:2463 stop:2891 length:429 start_codon:yes stop_codon:yes gene_type:complete